MAKLDQRLLRVTITIDDRVIQYTDLKISASGDKFVNTLQGDCKIKIANIKKDVRDFILTKSSPFSQPAGQVKVLVEAGRESTGYSRVYSGNVFRSSVSQPPDFELSLDCKSFQNQKSNIVAVSRPASSRLSDIAKSISNDLGIPLIIESIDKTVGSYSFTGAAIDQLERLKEMADIDVFIDDDKLIVKDQSKPVSGKIRKVNVTNGMVGSPFFTEIGVNLTVFYDAQTIIGGSIDLESQINPSLNGIYEIFKISYDLSNRDTPFYNKLECRRIKSG